jgi:sigma-B regulation protein RsbU (phosphoserine phosphatase)
MDETAAKLAPFALVGDADPVPASLYVSHPEQANTLALLYEVSREITSILDRQELLRQIAQRVKKLVNYHVFTVMLWNEKTQHLESAFVMRYGDSIPSRVRVPLHQGLTGAAASARRSVRVTDTLADPRFLACEVDTGVAVRSELVVPLLMQDRLIGVLDLESAETHAFTAEHERMLTTLGSYIAIALENARLYEEARESQRLLQEDLSTAREIQRQLLPSGAREVPGLDLAAGYCSARDLGGDFYDFLPYGKGRLGVALGDVSGKGTAAALFGSLAIGTIREHVTEHPCPPAEMLAMLNRRLHGARLDGRFIAMAFAVYDAGSRRLTLANAGGPYPLLVRDGEVQEIRVAGVPLGLFPDTEYDEMTLDLQPGDAVLFASDGILESENHKEQEFGAQRLRALLQTVSPQHSASEICDLILNATDEYSGGGFAPHDDRTLLVLRVFDHASSDFSKLPIIY